MPQAKHDPAIGVVEPHVRFEQRGRRGGDRGQWRAKVVADRAEEGILELVALAQGLGVDRLALQMEAVERECDLLAKGGEETHQGIAPRTTGRGVRHTRSPRSRRQSRPARESASQLAHDFRAGSTEHAGHRAPADQRHQVHVLLGSAHRRCIACNGAAHRRAMIEHPARLRHVARLA